MRLSVASNALVCAVKTSIIVSNSSKPSWTWAFAFRELRAAAMTGSANEVGDHSGTKLARDAILSLSALPADEFLAIGGAAHAITAERWNFEEQNI